MQEREQSAAFVAYPQDASNTDSAERTRTPITARPAKGRIDVDALIKGAMARYPTVRAYLAR